MTTDERLERLEKELTRAKRHNLWLLTTTGLIVLTLTLMRVFTGLENNAHAKGKGNEPRVVSANEFILEDGEGRCRSKLFVDTKGPCFNLIDEKDRLRAQLRLIKDEPFLILMNEKGNGSVSLNQKEQGVGLVLCDQEYRVRGVFAVTKSGAGIEIWDENGSTQWKAP